MSVNLGDLTQEEQYVYGKLQKHAQKGIDPERFAKKCEGMPDTRVFTILERFRERGIIGAE